MIPLEGLLRIWHIWKVFCVKKIYIKTSVHIRPLKSLGCISDILNIFRRSEEVLRRIGNLEKALCAFKKAFQTYRRSDLLIENYEIYFIDDLLYKKRIEIPLCGDQ